MTLEPPGPKGEECSLLKTTKVTLQVSRGSQLPYFRRTLSIAACLQVFASLYHRVVNLPLPERSRLPRCASWSKGNIGKTRSLKFTDPSRLCHHLWK